MIGHDHRPFKTRVHGPLPSCKRERLIAKCCVRKPCLVQKPREKEGENERNWKTNLFLFKMKIKIWATASFDIILKVLPKVQQYVDAETCWCAEEILLNTGGDICVWKRNERDRARKKCFLCEILRFSTQTM